MNIICGEITTFGTGGQFGGFAAVDASGSWVVIAVCSNVGIVLEV